MRNKGGKCSIFFRPTRSVVLKRDCLRRPHCSCFLFENDAEFVRCLFWQKGEEEKVKGVENNFAEVSPLSLSLSLSLCRSFFLTSFQPSERTKMKMGLKF